MIASVLALLLTGCGASAPAPAESQDSAKPAAEVQESEASAEESSEESSEEKAPETFNWSGIELTIPAEFAKDEYNTYANAWSAQTPSGDPVYLICEAMINYELLDDAKKDFTEEDVPEIIWKSMINDIAEYIDAGPNSTEKTVKDGEKTTFAGCSSQTENGTLQTNTGGTQHTLYYSAVYGGFDFPEGDHPHTPAVVITFTESEDGAAQDTVRSTVEAVCASAAKAQ